MCLPKYPFNLLYFPFILGVWQWYDQPLVYSNWKEHQILTEAGYCAALKTTMHSSSWYTGQCDAYNAKFVCELEE